MCDPMTLAITSTVLTAGSGYMNYQNSKREANAELAAAQTDKHVAEYNARLAENEAIRVRNKGVEEENRQRRDTAQLQSRQRAQLAANGIDINTGSAFQLIQDAEEQGNIDALTIRSNYADEADALEQQAILTGLQGDTALLAGQNRASSIRNRGRAEALSTVGSLAGKWYGPNSAASK